MMTIEQIDARIAANEEGIARMLRDGIKNHLEQELYDGWITDNALCTLARERLEAGTFNEGIEAAAKLCEAKGIGPWTPEAIRQLKRPP